MQTSDGQKILGRVVNAHDIQTVPEQLGLRHFQKIKCPAPAGFSSRSWGKPPRPRCFTVSIIFLAQPIYLGAFALKAKATAGHFICWISLRNQVLSPEELVLLVLNEGYSQQLPGGVTLRRSYIAAEPRIELVNAISLAE
ncbi:Superfamily II DNA or RNA helicase, SNF2 family (plasmid) [Nostoc flagelliforme CCNUN1]|uniref:Superfamily II DNA or RNA helicase, SNF2 family n=1 Tax=Nostoc flagelliforme CCNUN1 TaxID=2038116 RepID=A0A2K8T9I6_9NOSO|nr:hypothetical protein [Nostoc flagelliforme]AUB44253.1 Superfamily II DNA or RNA helicase, SNF2 family [Nostoc flagelliforme CCNUN1]